MTEHEIDAMIYNALSTPTGQQFHQWLVNNYLHAVEATFDPNQALFKVAQQSLVTAINTRYARHMTRNQKENEPNTRRSFAKQRFQQRQQPRSERSS